MIILKQRLNLSVAGVSFTENLKIENIGNISPAYMLAGSNIEILTENHLRLFFNSTDSNIAISLRLICYEKFAFHLCCFDCFCV